MSFLNKVVVITGAGSGIGEKTALHFAKLSARLALLDVSEYNLKKSAENCEKVSRAKVLKIVVDLTKDDEVKAAIDKTVKEYGRIDVLVNSAGIFGPGHILDKNLMKSFDNVMAINLRAVVSIIHYAAKELIKTEGSIVNVSSVAALVVLTNVPYSVGKAALCHFTRCVALELADKRVRVNAVLPGTVKTNLLVNSGVTTEDSDAIYKMSEATLPLKRLVKTDEVAELIAFLANDKAKGITGGSFVVDGGETLVGSQHIQDGVKDIVNKITITN